MTAPSTLTRDAKIADLFLLGNPIDTIAAAGRDRGWNRGDCLRVAAENGWALDPTGRIPRAQRKPNLAAAPAPRPVADLGPGRAQIGAMLGQTPAPQPPPVDRLIADGKAHSVPRVRKLAEKADTTLAELRRALKHEEGREQLRQRLAQLDAERDRLRAQLAAPGRPPKERTETTQPPPSSSDSAIEHGTWGGFLKEKRRGLDHCQPCLDAKDRQMDSLHGPRRAAAAEKSA